MGVIGCFGARKADMSRSARSESTEFLTQESSGSDYKRKNGLSRDQTRFDGSRRSLGPGKLCGESV